MPPTSPAPGEDKSPSSTVEVSTDQDLHPFIYFLIHPQGSASQQEQPLGAPGDSSAAITCTDALSRAEPFAGGRADFLGGIQGMSSS